MYRFLSFGLENFQTRLGIIFLFIFILVVFNATVVILKKLATKLNQRLLFFSNIALSTIILFLSVLTLFLRPFTNLETVSAGGYLPTAHEPIRISFSTPIKPDDVSLYVSPEVKGQWMFEATGPFLPEGYVNKATFVPEESFYPDTKIVVYAVGLKRLFPGGVRHEQSLEFFAPRLPGVKNTYPEDKQTNVSIKAPFEINFDTQNGEFAKWFYEIKPAVDFEVDQSDQNKTKLIFSKPLLQDTEYSLSIFRTARAYNVSDMSDLEVGESEPVKTISFKTVAAPNIKSYEPQGANVKADIPIKVVFAEAMNQLSVAEKFSLNPETPGVISWENEQTFVFTPSSTLERGVDYTIKFADGLKNAYGGKTDTAIELSFSTAGRVKIISIYPKNASYGLSPDLSGVTIEFNQEVDHTSAENAFSISPNVPGSFSWEGNKLTYAFGHSLAFATKYTVNLQAEIKAIYGLDLDQIHTYSFTTKNETFSLNIPLYYQDELFTCNLAATKMVLAYRGTNLSESAIKNAIGEGGDPNVNWVDGYGVHWGPIYNYISRYRNVSLKTGWNVTDMVREVKAGNPVIVWWHNQYSAIGAFTLDSGVTAYRGMHSVVVKGFVGSVDNPVSIIVNDSWRGQRTYSVSTFKSIWAYMGYTALVVY